MSLLDEARGASSVASTGPSCELGLWIAAQPDDVAGDVNEAIEAPWQGPGRVKHTVLLDLLNDKYGTGFTIDQLAHHRRRKCRCWR